MKPQGRRRSGLVGVFLREAGKPDLGLIRRTIQKEGLAAAPVENFVSSPHYWRGAQTTFRVVERYSWGWIVFARCGSRWLTAVILGHFNPVTGEIAGIQPDGAKYSARLEDLSEVYRELLDRIGMDGEAERPPCFGTHIEHPVCDGGIRNDGTVEPPCSFRTECGYLQDWNLDQPPTSRISGEDIDDTTLQAILRMAQRQYEPIPLPKHNEVRYITQRNQLARPVIEKSGRFFLHEFLRAIEKHNKTWIKESKEEAGSGDLYLRPVKERHHGRQTVIYMRSVLKKEAHNMGVSVRSITLAQVTLMPMGWAHIDLPGEMSEVRRYLGEKAKLLPIRDSRHWKTRVSRITLEDALNAAKYFNAEVYPLALEIWKRRKKRLRYLRSAVYLKTHTLTRKKRVPKKVVARKRRITMAKRKPLRLLSQEDW